MARSIPVVLLALLLTSTVLAAELSCLHCGALNPSQKPTCPICGREIVPGSAAGPSTQKGVAPDAHPLARPSPAPQQPSTPTQEATLVDPTQAKKIVSSESSPQELRPEGMATAEHASLKKVRAGSREGGLLILRSNPPGATVTTRGLVLGRTPFRETLKPGRYRLDISLPDRETGQLRVRIRSGQTIRKSIDLLPAQDIRTSVPERPTVSAQDTVPVAKEGPTLRAPERAHFREKATVPTGTLVLELVHRGPQIVATTCGVRIDEGPMGQTEGESAALQTDMVRVYRFSSLVRPGPHRVVITLLGVRSDRPDGTMEESRKLFEVFVSPGEIQRVYHEWSGGIEEFPKSQECCSRNHAPPR